MKFAWIENDTVRDICPGDPAECYHPDIAGHYSTEIPDDIERGATLVNGEWVNPTPPTPAAPAHPDVTVSPVEFLLLFTSPERVYIKSIRTSDPVVGDFMDIVEHPRLTLVNLTLPSTLQAVDYILSQLATAGILSSDQIEGRRVEILSGKFQ